MILIRDFPSIDTIPDPDLRQLLQELAADLRQYNAPLSDLALFIIVQPGDTLADIEAQLGRSILASPWTGIRFGQPGFTPSWEIFEEHPGWYELVFVMDDSGFGVELFIPKNRDIDPELLALCRTYATPGADT